jgi:geranylgeranyl diphosphate synthase, type I
MSNLASYIAAVESAMRDAIRSPSAEIDEFYGWMRYHLGWANEQFQAAQVDGGKRLRPVFCLLACEALSGQWAPALRAAAAIEILHNFSLVHDDIEDGDERRRHRPTLWTLVGVPHAINAGDALFALAQRELLRSRTAGVSAERMLRAAEIFEQTCVELVEGQYLDMRAEAVGTTSLSAYRQMIGGKTASLLGAATAIGACVASDDLDIIALFQRFGIELGLAFQIQDDILGLWGDPEITGKAAGADLRHKKKSLPIVLAQSDGGALAERLNRLFAQNEIGEGDVGEVMQWFNQAGIKGRAEEEASHHAELASQTLEKLQAKGMASPTAMRTLAELTSALTTRKF